MRLTLCRQFAPYPIVLAALAACGGKENVPRQARLSLDTAAFMKPTAHKYGPPTGKIRVAHLLEMNGQPAGPVDLYDMRKPDSTDVPIIKGLAYGQISDYVSPRAEGPYSGARSQLYLFPAGAKTATSPWGTNIDNIGFNPGDQLTIALGPSRGFGNGPAIAMVQIGEGGSRLAPVDTGTAPAGQAMAIVRTANDNADSLPQLYLDVDGSCNRGTTEKERSLASGAGNFPLAAGTHTVGVVTSPRGQGLSNCNGKTPGTTTSVNAAAGQRLVIFIYGVPSDGFKAVAAPIPPVSP